jgi:hydrogenase nickel incorporation protein HypA/HybF
MHELGVVIEIVKTVEEFARNNGVTKIDTVTLQIGELSSMIPKYIEECWPCAVDGTTLEGTKLAIEIITANALCKGCGKVYGLLQNKKGCPACGSEIRDILGGKEFMIKEILAC